MTTPYSGHDRRSSRISSDEIDSIADKFMERLTIAAENIGYDITTPESRAEINKDHQFLRDWRTGTSTTKTAAVGVGITTIIGGVLWLLWNGILQALTTGKAP